MDEWMGGYLRKTNETLHIDLKKNASEKCRALSCGWVEGWRDGWVDGWISEMGGGLDG